jgi:acetyl esterase/lipase
MRFLLPAFLTVTALTAEPLPTFDVFSGQPPGETLTMKEGQDPHGTKTPGHRGNVFAPELTPWPAARPGSPIILICPGGGYNGLADGHEGDEVAKRLNAYGCGAVILRYRVPRRDPLRPWVVPLLDARAALEIVRARAKEWNADPAKVGILGFSAGGNLAARAAYSPSDVAVPRPDFAVMIYPAYLFEQDKPESVLREGPEGVVPPKSPKPPVPAFFAHSADDRIPAEGSMALAAKLKSLGGSAEVHVWAKGGHGWGATDRCEAAKVWTETLRAWLIDQRLLAPL